MIDRKQLIVKLDGLCWSARRYGHDDYGLDCGEGIEEPDPDDPDDIVDTYHPEAIALADELLELMS